MLKCVFLAVLLVVVTGPALSGMEKGKITPIPLYPLRTTIYFAVASERPGSVYSLNLLTGSVSVLYTRPSGRLYSFIFHPEIPEKLYYVNANENKIFRVLWLGDRWSEEEVVYEHTTYVRDIAFGPEPPGVTPGPGERRLTLFFSEATGAGGGKIYYLDGRNRPVLYYEVHMPWAGDFAFDENGVLYLSSGNIVPAKLYRVEGGTVYTLYQRSGPIKGFVVRDGKVYFADWGGSIYVFDLSTGEVQEVFRNPRRFRWLSDVGFRP
ncbi:hypothetical protein ACVNPS_02775 [Candidatus Bipolaricaulota sp. J31]